MLSINYIEDLSVAEITTNDEGNLGWYEVRRLCMEEAKDAEIVSDSMIRMPWWSFLPLKTSIRNILIKYNIKLVPSKSAATLLKKSNDGTKRYKNAINSDTQIFTPQHIEDTLISRGFERELKPYQLSNVTQLAGLPAGATFSVPGAGKTTEAVALYTFRKKEDTKLLIVAPKNAFAAWEETVQKCLPANTPSIVRLRGGANNIKGILKTNPDIMLVTYQQLPNAVSEISHFLSNKPFFMFLDESHRIKRGSNGVYGKTVLNMAHLPELKLIMSGTPLPNKVSDLIPQLNFLYPELKADENTVVERVRPIYVRTTKDKLDIPPVNYKTTKVQMSVAQRKLYNLLRSEELRQAEILFAKDRNQLRSLGKSVLTMLQVASNPALLAKRDFKYPDFLKDVLQEGDSPKIAYVCSRARQLAKEKRKVIIWSSFVENVELISRRLVDLGAEFIHGGVDSGSEEDTETREAKIKNFHYDDNRFVLVANPAAAGEGISLHKVCHDAIYLDRSYNAAHFMQSVDRIHRLGLDKNDVINVEIVESPDSIDQSVDRRLTDKINRMSVVLDDPSIRVVPEYTDEELDFDGLTENDIFDYLNHLRGK